MAQRVQRQANVLFLRHPVDQRGADPRLAVITRRGATRHPMPAKAFEKAIARRFAVALWMTEGKAHHVHIHGRQQMETVLGR